MSIEFKTLPIIRYGTDPMAEALERKRQLVLKSSWRPPKCAVPWTLPEESDYRAMNPHLYEAGARRSFAELASSGMIDRELAEVMDRDNVLPFIR